MWSVLASLYPSKKHPERVLNYVQHADDFDVSDMSFPLKICDIPKFEKKNNISVNVFGYEKNMYPLFLTKERGLKHVDLLLIHRGENYHYCSIKNFNRLMVDQNADNNQYFYFHYCLHGFIKKGLLTKHVPYCQVHGAQRTEMPSEEEKWLKYTDVSKQLRVPFVVYANFESLLERQYGCQPDPSKFFTTKLARHVPSGFTYKIVGITPETTEKYVTYRVLTPWTCSFITWSNWSNEPLTFSIIQNP